MGNRLYEGPWSAMELRYTRMEASEIKEYAMLDSIHGIVPGIAEPELVPSGGHPYRGRLQAAPKLKLSFFARIRAIWCRKAR